MIRTTAIVETSSSLSGVPETKARRVASRYVLVMCFALVCLAVAGITRAGLVLKTLAAGQISANTLPAVVAIGTAYDLLASLYLSLPFTLYLLLLPEKLYRTRTHRAALWAGMFLSTFGICYLAAVEFFFFDEFNARFNFVAVEYLIYPHEVFVNIWESYPVARAMAAAALIAAALTWWLRPHIATALQARGSLRARLAPAAVALAVAALTSVGVDSTAGRVTHNRVADELAANGIYSFFSAATSSHLDYLEYYTTIDETEASQRVQRLVAQKNTRFLAGARNPLARQVHYAGAPKLLNVIVLLEESLGAEFIGAYGAPHSLTPNLDRLAEQSLVFTNTYATGTRTVRGMEAVTASFPPVPAESIVKRPHNEGMFNWSQVMEKNGYHPTFIYGGYGTFDNMNHFFGNNGYRVIDRTTLDTPDFANIWGVSDGDLFRNALRVFDQQYARGERIFSVIMTTSNHPFTYPSGVAGVKPKGGT
jgi:phosphoglycerol transferase MdoB-like AlkP superfamily enzyme